LEDRVARVLADPEFSLNRGFPENPTDPALWIEYLPSALNMYHLIEPKGLRQGTPKMD